MPEPQTSPETPTTETTSLLAPKAQQPPQGTGAPEAPPEAPPESYELQFPDGMQIDDAMLNQAKEMFRADGLSAQAAQRYADLMVGKIAEIGRAFEYAKLQQSQQWADQTRADAEIGGPRLTEHLGYARKALDAYAPEGLLADLEATGMANHPGLIKLLAKVGKVLSEDRFQPGGQLGGGQVDRAKILYPDMN